MLVQEVLSRLRQMQNPTTVESWKKQGITPRAALGVSNSDLGKLAAEVGVDRLIAQQLWASGIHDARVLASLVDDPERVTPKQMERWVRDFDSWALCDACCFNLFHKTPFAYAKAVAWSARKEEFVKRAAFSLVAALAVNDGKASEKEFLRFLPIAKREAPDERPFVRKSVAWSLREMGKRSKGLKKLVLDLVKELDATESKSAHLIAADVEKELSSNAGRASAPKAAKKSASAKSSGREAAAARA
jgi:3-methyladenine DNA glycosylase AlkD